MLLGGGGAVLALTDATYAPCSWAQIRSKICLNWSVLGVGAIRCRFRALPNFKTLRPRATAKTAQGTRINRGREFTGWGLGSWCPGARASGRSGRWSSCPSAVSQRSGQAAAGASSGLAGSCHQRMARFCCWRLPWRKDTQGTPCPNHPTSSHY